MKKLHVAVAQVHSGGSLADTLGRVEQQAAAAAAVGAEVILFAEVALGGYDYDLSRATLEALAEPLAGPTCDRVVAIARRLRLAILAGFWERSNGGIYNSHLVARPDGTRAVERKHNLTPGELKAGVSQGQRARTVFEFGGVRTAVLICADTGIEGIVPELKAQGVQYRFIPTAGGGKLADYLHEADLATPEGRKRYEENRLRVFKTQAILDDKECPGLGFAAANALGPVGAQTCHQGHCMIVDNAGVMRAQIPGTIVLEHQQDQMLHAELTFA